MNIADIQAALVQTAANWLAPGSQWRARAIAAAPGTTGFSPEMVDEAVTLTFGALTRPALSQFIVPADAPRRITHILSGNVPAPGIGSICRGVLLQSLNLVKCSRHDPVFPALFVESLREVDAKLAKLVTVMCWSRDENERTQSAVAGADAVFAYGDDNSIAELRALTPPTTSFFGYGHRLSFAIIGRAATPTGDLPALAAFDASVYDQQGCMSPHVFFVEHDARGFAVKLALAMADYAMRVPGGRLSTEEAAAVARVRHAYEFRSANDQRVAIWSGQPQNQWTVIYDETPAFTPSCLNRTVFVKPLSALDTMQTWRGKISTIGVTPRTDRLSGLTAQFLPERVCPIGQMQRPPLFFTGKSS